MPTGGSADGHVLHEQGTLRYEVPSTNLILLDTSPSNTLAHLSLRVVLMDMSFMSKVRYE